MIDLRSDTVTKPSLAMRQAMFEAEDGEDTVKEDPTVKRLENYAAEIMGKEAGLFVATGTLGNLLSVMAHCERGDEYIAGYQSHLFRVEGGSCILGSTYPCPIDYEKDGTIDLDKVKKAIKPQTKLLTLENTQSGKVLPIDYFKSASQLGLKMHLDGARIFNAAVASNVPAREIAKYFDSVTFCVSKGLGAPIGSIICAEGPFIEKATRLRKLVGGWMRQAGSLAAAGIWALDHNIPRLAEDHVHAELLGQGLMNIEELQGKVRVHTNMVFVDVGPLGRTEMPAYFRSKGILIFGNETLRLVIHLDISRQDIETVVQAFQELCCMVREKNHVQ